MMQKKLRNGWKRPDYESTGFAASLEALRRHAAAHRARIGKYMQLDAAVC